MSASLSISSKFIREREREEEGRKEEEGDGKLSGKSSARAVQPEVVGGRPAGVEFSAEIHDFVVEDKAKLYPSVKDDVSITIIEASSCEILILMTGYLSDATMAEDALSTCMTIMIGSSYFL
ncbi:external alternative NAD(P)H-ubiquinone oxidoreductase B2, mitochondrial-like isoform X2 [Rosa rugosa]|uniref:external alternative NAD(P)H-ubiquinone oxidoreductase B2, mitochondrial-like isoform X2 n=1 Tax=Rosa rugosa TaxID=74645 RepID=UPI002B40C032|nr:external alternative NAD(P)H-ubiquinone oxidoreductase B2, mitochondrial-like isoform X2 [Rosa rugosa]